MDATLYLVGLDRLRVEAKAASNGLFSLQLVQLRPCVFGTVGQPPLWHFDGAFTLYADRAVMAQLRDALDGLLAEPRVPVAAAVAAVLEARGLPAECTCGRTIEFDAEGDARVRCVIVEAFGEAGRAELQRRETEPVVPTEVPAG